MDIISFLGDIYRWFEERSGYVVVGPQKRCERVVDEASNNVERGNESEFYWYQLENIKKSYNGMEVLVAPVQLRSASHREQKVEK
jgi:ATP-dependent helicase YprA (DUF1998 family)